MEAKPASCGHVMVPAVGGSEDHLVIMCPFPPAGIKLISGEHGLQCCGLCPPIMIPCPFLTPWGTVFCPLYSFLGSKL